MNDHIMVQFMGFQSKILVREYTFLVREADTEPREYTLTIALEAFDAHRVRYQDAPDICSHRLRRELAAAGNHPPNTHFRLTDAELDDYRAAHTQKFSKHPYPPRRTDQPL